MYISVRYEIISIVRKLEGDEKVNFFKRALCSVTRKKGKSFILFIVIFILGNVIAGAIAIQQSTQNVEKNIKKQLGAAVTIGLDYESIEDKLGDENFFKDLNYLTVEKMEKIGASKYVKYYDYNIIYPFKSEKLKGASMNDENEGVIAGGDGNYLTAKGTNYAAILDVQEKKITLKEGSAFSKEDIEKGHSVAVISSKLADENGYSVGDQMIIDEVGEEYHEEEPKKIYSVETPVTIVGIFEPAAASVKEQKKDHSSKAYSEQMYLDNEQLNTIYLPNKVLETMVNESKEKFLATASPEEKEMMELTSIQSMYMPYYVLKSPDDVEVFKQEIKPLIPEYFAANASSDQYEHVGGGMKKMATMSNYVVWIAVIATLSIITLVVLLFMRDRKHELGIYLSIGERRSRVMGQIIIEMLIIGGLALIFSLITGNFLGKIVSESLLNSDLLTAAGEADYGLLYAFGPQAQISDQDIFNAYTVNFSLGYMITYLTVGLGTILLAAILPLVYILRLNPKKIMM